MKLGSGPPNHPGVQSFSRRTPKLTRVVIPTLWFTTPKRHRLTSATEEARGAGGPGGSEVGAPLSSPRGAVGSLGSLAVLCRLPPREAPSLVSGVSVGPPSWRPQSPAPPGPKPPPSTVRWLGDSAWLKPHGSEDPGLRWDIQGLGGDAQSWGQGCSSLLGSAAAGPLGSVLGLPQPLCSSWGPVLWDLL